MLPFARSTAIAVPLLLAAGFTSPAAAQEMFGGFFNRLIPGSSATPAPAPAPGPVVEAKPAPLPPDPTQANPFAGGHGGLVNAMNGQDPGCSGVLCTFMGGERGPRAPSPPRTSRTQAELDAIDAIDAPHARRRSDGSIEPPPEKRCVDNGDPWRCYR